MATLKKPTVTEWRDNNGKRVKPNTPGAKKVSYKAPKWYIVHKEAGRVKRIPAYTDKKASQAKLVDFLKAKERGEAGLTDPFKEHYDRPVLDHVQEYHQYVAAHSRSDKHPAEVLRILKAVVAGTKVISIRDITPGRVSVYLTGMTQASGTKNMHRRILVSFMNWLETAGRIPTNPIGGKKVRTFEPKPGEAKRRRRAMTGDELSRLFAAAREQPLRDAARSRGGRPRKDGSKPATARPAQLSDETILKKTHEGRERWLMYRIAAFTGLRRGELSRLRVRHVKLDRDTPMIHLPGVLTKNGVDARLLLPGFLAADLKSWVAESGKRDDDPMVHVPNESNLAKTHRRMLKAAGIEYQDGEGRYADFHSLRKTTNVLLRQAGIPLKDRMAFLRHGSASLTDGIYEDEAMTDKAGILDTFRQLAV